MLYSPIQEVPATPVLRPRATNQSHGIGTPYATNLNDFAVVPDDFAVVPEDFLDRSQDLSASVPGTPSVSEQHFHLNGGTSSSLRREDLRCTSSQSNTPRTLLVKSPAGIRSCQEQIVPGTPVGGFIQYLNTPRMGWSTPDNEATGPYLATTPTSRPRSSRKKYIRTYKLCFGPSTSNALPDGDHMEENKIAPNVDHIVDATGDNLKSPKKHNVSVKESRNASQNAYMSSECHNKSKSSSDSSSAEVRGSDVINDFLDMI